MANTAELIYTELLVAHAPIKVLLFGCIGHGHWFRDRQITLGLVLWGPTRHQPVHVDRLLFVGSGVFNLQH